MSSKITIPSRRTFDAAGVVLVIEGVNTGDLSGYNALQLADYAYDVSVNGLTLRGLHTGGVTNAQMSALHLGTKARNITITNCVFEDLVGFSAQSYGGDGCSVTDCVFSNCGNGLNINMDNARFANNEFVDSEGIEAAGTHNTIEDNTFTNAYNGAISIGGDVGGRSLPGIVVRRNIINGVVTPAGSGIVIADGCNGAIVENNEVYDSGTTGIVVTRGEIYPTAIIDSIIRNNIIKGANIGIYLPNISDIDGTLVDGNTVQSDASTNFGILDEAPGVDIVNNNVAGAGVTNDIYIQSTAVGTTLSGNVYNTLRDDR